MKTVRNLSEKTSLRLVAIAAALSIAVYLMSGSGDHFTLTTRTGLALSTAALVLALACLFRLSQGLENPSWTFAPSWSRERQQARQALGAVTLVVRDYDEAIMFFVGTLGFSLLEDRVVEAENKRWVLVAPPGSTEARLLLARAEGAEEASRIGNQTGGRVGFFLHTDDFWRDYETYTNKGVVFLEEPREEDYGTVAVFEDLYGNRWDLLEGKE